MDNSDLLSVYRHRRAEKIKARMKKAGIARYGVADGHEYVDVGLSVLWATCNVGAADPQASGDYFAWGEIEPKAEYTEANSLTAGKEMGDIAGDPRYDAARARWGGGWRMPTRAEMEERMNWLKSYSFLTAAPGVMLPPANYREKESCEVYKGLPIPQDGSLPSDYIHSACYYWTSTPIENDTDLAAFYYFSDLAPKMLQNARFYGQCIRPVLDRPEGDDGQAVRAAVLKANSRNKHVEKSMDKGCLYFLLALAGVVMALIIYGVIGAYFG